MPVSNREKRLNLTEESLRTKHLQLMAFRPRHFSYLHLLKNNFVSDSWFVTGEIALTEPSWDHLFRKSIFFQRTWLFILILPMRRQPCILFSGLKNIKVKYITGPQKKLKLTPWGFGFCPGDHKGTTVGSHPITILICLPIRRNLNLKVICNEINS